MEFGRFGSYIWNVSEMETALQIVRLKEKFVLIGDQSLSVNTVSFVKH